MTLVAVDAAVEAAASHNVAGQLVFGVLCVGGVFALIFGVWGYSALGLRSYAPLAAVACALVGLALFGLGPW